MLLLLVTLMLEITLMEEVVHLIIEVLYIKRFVQVVVDKIVSQLLREHILQIIMHRIVIMLFLNSI